MLEADPRLTPNLVKLALLLSAVKLQEPHMLEQGNGLVNAQTAVTLARSLHVRNQLVTGRVSPTWADAGAVWAGGAFAYGDQIIFSSLVKGKKADFWGSGISWSNYLSDDKDWASGIFWSGGQFWGSDIFWASDSLAWTNLALWSGKRLASDNLVWADPEGGGVFWSDVAADGVFWADAQGVCWADGVSCGDSRSNSAAGDP